jgi:hypothetical protein
MSRTAPRIYSPGKLSLYLAVMLSTLVAHISSAALAASDVYVRPGQTIQAVINAAPKGTRIHVPSGTFSERLTIKKEGISLIGTGATILTDPGSGISNSCSGFSGMASQAGICIEGDGINFDPNSPSVHLRVLSVMTPIKGVTVTGFQIQGFSGNIVVIGGQDTNIVSNKLVDSPNFGFLSVGSLNTKATGNTISSANRVGAFGMGTDDKSVSTFSGNTISGYNVGVSIQTTGGQVLESTIKDCCSGVSVERGVSDAKIVSNKIGPFPAVCATGPGGAGVVLNGAVRAAVVQNIISGEVNAGTAAGIIIQDDSSILPKAIASGNRFALNVLTSNDVDFSVKTAATNTYALNVCATSKFCNSVYKGGM